MEQDRSRGGRLARARMARMTTPLRPLQAEFMTHTWGSTDRSYHQVFALLDLACEPDPRPGVAIFTNQRKDAAVAVTVDDLSKQWDALRKEHSSLPVIYWRMFLDVKERDAVAAKLGKNPRFYG